MRVQRDALALAPALPDGITRLAFRVQWHGTRLLVEADGDEVRCTVHGPSGAGVPLRLYGEDLEVTIPDPVIRPFSIGSRCCAAHRNRPAANPKPECRAVPGGRSRRP